MGFNQEKIKEGLKEVDQNVCGSITISGGGGIGIKAGNFEEVGK